MSKRRKLDLSYQFILDHIDEYAAENENLKIEINRQRKSRRYLRNLNEKNKEEKREIEDENLALLEKIDDKKQKCRNFKLRISALEDIIKDLDEDFEVSDVDVSTYSLIL